jgi:hypothetical protein
MKHLEFFILFLRQFVGEKESFALSRASCPALRRQVQLSVKADL